MATTVNCDICKTEITGPVTVLIDGGIYRLEVTPFHVPIGIKPLADICSRCFAKRIGVIDMQGASA